jgi:multidrug efflux pump subunit AcrA (membrane-fusion protein)/uncharacterized ParB-like nuclease family protein
VDQQQEQIERLTRKIRDLVREIVVLSTSSVAPGEFFREFLGRVLSAMEAPAGAVWYAGVEGQLRLGAAVQLDHIPFVDFLPPGQTAGASAEDGPRSPTADLEAFIKTVVVAVLREKKPAILGPPSAETAAGAAPLLLAPILADQAPAGVLLVETRQGTDPRALRGMITFMSEVCRQAAIYIQQQRLRAMVHIQEHTQGLVGLLEQAHATLDPVRVAFALANQGQAFVGCDRLTVAAARGRKTHVLAVSGHDVVQRRSVLMKRLTDLARLAVRTRATLRDAAPPPEGDPPTMGATPESAESATHRPLMDAALSTAPPDRPEARRRRALAAYRQATQMRALAVVPLLHHGRAVGALVAEGKAADALTDAHVARLNEVARHGASALANALRYDALPLLKGAAAVKGLLARLFGRTAPRILLRLAFVAAPILALVFIPYELKVTGAATVNPRNTRVAYAQSDGIIREVLVQEGEAVAAGQVLARTNDAALRAQVAGQEAELRAQEVQLRRYEASPDPRQSGQAETQRLVVEQHRAMLAYLERQLELTEVRAPIAGAVLNQRPEELLQKPVTRGEPLFRIAPLHESWDLEIDLPEAEIGHVLEARQRAAGAPAPLTVGFYLHAYPQRRFTTVLRQVAPQAAVARDRNVVRLTADLPPDLPDIKPQMGGEAQVYCGRRSLGYVLFRGVFDFFRTHLNL